MTIKLVVGLQNPGARYENTRHNAGAWFASALVSALGGHFRLQQAFHGEVASLTLNDSAFYVLLPHTWMNESGRAVRALCQFYRILPTDILVAHDDLDLSPGVVRLKSGGGHGGHNGLRDLIAHTATAHFHRLRIGIGHPGHKDLVSDYVLTSPNQRDRTSIDAAIQRALTVMPAVLSGQFAAAMQILNTNQPIED